MNSSLVYDNFRRVWLQLQCKMFEEKKSDAMPPGNCSRRYQNTGVLEEVQDEKVPGPLLTLTTVEEASFSYTFHKKNCASFKPTFEYLTPPPFKIKVNRLAASIFGLRCERILLFVSQIVDI